MNKTDRRIIRTHKAIRDAYFDLIKENGNTKISISEIARKADIDRKTFYLHFNSTQDVLDEYLGEIIEEMRQALQESEHAMDPLSVDVVFKVLADTQNRDMDFLQIISKSEAYNKLWNRSRDELVSQAVSLYKNKTNLPEEELKIQIEFFISGILDVYRRWLSGDYNVSFKKMSRIMSNVAHNGMQLQEII